MNEFNKLDLIGYIRWNLTRIGLDAREEVESAHNVDLMASKNNILPFDGIFDPPVNSKNYLIASFVRFVSKLLSAFC